MKIITAQEAAGLIADGSTVAIGGFGAYGCPDQLLDAVVQRHRTCGHPAALTVFTGIGTGNNTDDNVGLNRLCDDGLMETLIAAHLANCPKIGRMVGENRLAAYVLPLGVVHICCGPLPVSNPACSPMWDWAPLPTLPRTPAGQ